MDDLQKITAEFEAKLSERQLREFRSSQPLSHELFKLAWEFLRKERKISSLHPGMLQILSRETP